MAYADPDTTYNMIATYYADFFVGRKTSSGDVFTQDKMTCAHKSIPLGSYVEVVNRNGGQRVVLKVNDRCPKRGVLDMTRTAMAALGIKGKGYVSVRILPGMPSNFVLVPPADDDDDEMMTEAYDDDDLPYWADYGDDDDEIVETTKTTVKSTKKDNNVSKAKPAKRKRGSGPYFDIVLSTEHTLKKAEQRASLLSLAYLDDVEYVKVGSGYQVIIRLGYNEKEVQPIVEELQETFPRLMVISAD